MAPQQTGLTVRCTPSVFLGLVLLSLILLPSRSFAEGQLAQDISPAPAAGPYTQKLSDWALHLGTHLRTSYNVLGNTVDLDHKNGTDDTQYLGYAYDFAVDLRHISGIEVYSFIERRGRADYDAPLASSQPIKTIFGKYHLYNGTIPNEIEIAKH